MKLHVGAATAVDARTAARSAVGDALRDDDRPAFALVVCTDQYDVEELASTVTSALGRVPWAGCCTAGVFAGAELLERGVVVGALYGRDAAFGVGVAGPVSRDPRGSGARAVSDAVASLPPRRPDHHRAFIVLPDTVLGDATEIVRGCAQAAGAGDVWAGGGAGDNLGLVRTAQFGLGSVLHDHVVVVAIDSPRPLSAAIRHGWKPYGPPTLVTRARESTAIELEYEPAFEVYRRTAAARGDVVEKADFPTFAMMHPLGIPQADGEFVIRDPLRVDAEGAVRCLGEVPSHAIVRVMEGERQALIEAAGAAAASVCESAGAPMGGALVFDCVSRALLLGEAIDEELRAIRDGLGPDVPMMGCLAFGEIGGLGRAAPQFHNKTTVVVGLPNDDEGEDRTGG